MTACKEPGLHGLLMTQAARMPVSTSNPNPALAGKNPAGDLGPIT